MTAGEKSHANKEHLILMEVLSSRTGHYTGVGITHENKEFEGELELNRIVNGKGLLLKYKSIGITGTEFNKHENLYNKDTKLYSEEHTIIAYDSKNHISLWTLSSNINTFIKFDLKRYRQAPANRHLFIFGFGKHSDFSIYREEITIELWENGDLSYNYAWGEAGGHFVSHSTIRMKKSDHISS
jgi:hypothetical protein